MRRGRAALLALAGQGACTFMFPFTDGAAGGHDPQTCAELLAARPGAESGPYVLAGRTVECEMDRAGGGWALVALFDTREGGVCPSPWRTVDLGEAEPPVCARAESQSGSEDSVELIVPQRYREVMGLALGMQFETPDAFSRGSPVGLDGLYVDGLSLTIGVVRRHVFTYAAGGSDHDEGESQCPCLGGASAPEVVGDQFACESGARDAAEGWLVGDLLWDDDLDPTSCDAVAAPSYFVADLGEPVDDPLEARLMADQESTNEDVGLVRLELFVR